MRNVESIFFTSVIRLSGDFRKLLKKFSEIIYNLFLMALVGCAHRSMSRPYTIGGVTHRICPDCGAYRLYDLEKMQFYGTYFYRFPAGEAAKSYLIAGSLPLGGQIKQAA